MLRDIITALVMVLNQCRACAGRGIKILGDEYVQAILGVSPPDSTAEMPCNPLQPSDLFPSRRETKTECCSVDELAKLTGVLIVDNDLRRPLSV